MLMALLPRSCRRSGPALLAVRPLRQARFDSFVGPLIAAATGTNLVALTATTFITCLFERPDPPLAWVSQRSRFDRLDIA